MNTVVMDLFAISTILGHTGLVEMDLLDRVWLPSNCLCMDLMTDRLASMCVRTTTPVTMVLEHVVNHTVYNISNKTISKKYEKRIC